MAINMARASGERWARYYSVMATTGSTSKIRRMVMAYLLGNQEMYTKATMWMTRERAMVRCTGLMAHATVESGSKASKMAMERCPFLMDKSRKDNLRIMSLLERPLLLLKTIIQ